MSSRKGGLSEDMTEELMSTFKMLDQGDDGTIDYNKFLLALKVHGFEPSQESLAPMKKLDTIGAGEYMNFMTTQLGESNNWCKLEVQEAFEVFDKEKTGIVTIPQIKRVVNRIGEKLTDSEIDQQYYQFDMNSDMSLDIAGFSKAAITNDAKNF